MIERHDSDAQAVPHPQRTLSKATRIVTGTDQPSSPSQPEVPRLQPKVSFLRRADPWRVVSAVQV